MYRDTTDAQNELAATAQMGRIMAEGPQRRAAKRAELAERLAKMAEAAK